MLAWRHDHCTYCWFPANSRALTEQHGKGIAFLCVNHQLQAPATAELAEAFENMKDMGILMGKGGLYGNVFRIKPPMCLTQADADFLVDVMDHCLDRL